MIGHHHSEHCAETIHVIVTLITSETDNLPVCAELGAIELVAVGRNVLFKGGKKDGVNYTVMLFDFTEKLFGGTNFVADFLQQVVQMPQMLGDFAEHSVLVRLKIADRGHLRLGSARESFGNTLGDVEFLVIVSHGVSFADGWGWN